MATKTSTRKTLKRKSVKRVVHKVPLWDLDRDGVTQSLLKSFRRCPEQTRLNYVLGWTPKRPSMPLEFGSAFHHLCEVIDTQSFSRELIEEELSKYGKKRRKELIPLSTSDREDIEKQFGLVEIMFFHYCEHWSTWDKKCEWISKEEPFKVQQKPSHEHYLRDRVYGYPSTYLRGKMDGLFTRTNKIWLLETKTLSKIDLGSLMAALPSDLQTLFYLHAARTHLDQDSKKISGAYYNLIQKPQQRQGKHESLKDFLDRVDKDVAKDTTKYYHRVQLNITYKEIDEWIAKHLDPLIYQVRCWWNWLKDDFENPWGSPHHFVDHSSLWSMYGQKTSYFDAITAGDFSSLKQRNVPFPELET